MNLTQALCQALRLPKNTTHAVLTLSLKNPPKLEVTVLLTNKEGHPIIDVEQDALSGGIANRIKQVDFVAHLTPASSDPEGSMPAAAPKQEGGAA